MGEERREPLALTATSFPAYMPLYTRAVPPAPSRSVRRKKKEPNCRTPESARARSLRVGRRR